MDDLELSPLATAYARARGADRVSSFGDFVALSDTVDLSTAKLLKRGFGWSHCSGFEDEALEVLKSKRKGMWLSRLILLRATSNGNT